AIDTLNKIIREPPPPMTDFRPDAPNHLQRVVRRCLAKDRDDRYQTIRDVAVELRELRRELEDFDTTVPPPSGPMTSASGAETSPPRGATPSPHPTSSAEYIVTGIKRHKLVVVIAILVIAAAGLGIGLFLHARNAEATIDSIAVVPFVNQSRNPDTEYLSDGLTESIINNLIQVPSLRVSPRSSVFHYKG